MAQKRKPPPNPLSCGCAVYGVHDLERAVETGYSLEVPWKSLHVRHCPKHAAAGDLLAACEAMLADVEYAEKVGDPCCVGSPASRMAREAIKKAKGG